MTRTNGNKRRMAQLGLSVVMMVGLSACASGGVVKMTESAPITYKLGQGSAQYASLTTPQSGLRSKRPRAVNRNLNTPRATPRSAPRAMPLAPEAYTPQAIEPRQMEPVGPGFNPATVDSRLYAHQKVGKPYSIYGQSYTPRHNPSYDRSGMASWYGEKFHGRPTATGEIYDMNDITAAHKTLPLNSMVHVENLENGRSLLVRVNDRGPFVGGRIIDLSKGAATALGTISNGIAKVRVRYVGPADPNGVGRQVSLPPVSTPPAYEQAPAPVYEAPSYTQEPQVSLPSVPQDYFDMPRPQETAPLSADPIFPADPYVSEPMADPYANLGPDTGGQITMTIKGPIHIAKHNGTTNKARLIHTVNRPNGQSGN